MDNGEEIETPSVRGTEVGADSNADNQNRVDGFTPDSKIAQHNSSRLSRETGSISNGENRRTIAGGMLRQLIEETIDQLQHNEIEHRKLESRLANLQALFEELSQKTGEKMVSNDINEEE